MTPFAVQPWDFLRDLGRTEGIGLVAAAALIVLNFFLLPRKTRRRQLTPLALLLCHLVALGLEQLFDEGSTGRLTCRVASLFLIISCNGVSVFLLLTRFVFAGYFQSVAKIFIDIVQGTIYLLALLVTLPVAGVEVSSLLTGSALLTAVIGLSMRDTLGNVFAGLALQAQRPFAVGDWIQFDGVATHVGRVVEINWRATTLVTLDAVEIVVPNAMLGAGLIVNFSRPQAWVRRSVYFEVATDVPPQRVHAVALEAIAGAPGVLETPPATILSHEFTASGVRYWVRFFTTEFERRDVIDGGVRDRIWYALTRDGIALPINLHQVEVRHAAPKAAPDETRLASERVEALRCVDFFGLMSDEALAGLGRMARSRLYAAGEPIIRQGDRGGELFIITRGEVAVLVKGAAAEVEVARLGPRNFFGEMSLLTGDPRTATVKATRECEVLVVGHEAFKQTLDATPQLAERISETVVARQANRAGKLQAAEQGAAAHHDGARHLLERIRDFFSV